MITQEECLKKISDYLAYLKNVIEFRNEAGLYDLNTVSESFYGNLINLFYDWSLENANNSNKNSPAIDLIDSNNRIAIQVTSDNSSEKIKHTINEFIKNQLYEDFSRLIIFHIRGSQKSYNTKFDTEHKFIFSKENDIWDAKTLIQQAKKLDTEKLKKICDFFQSELDNKSTNNNKLPEASEVETIIALIDFITSHRQTQYRKINNIIDPDYKINERFRNFANNLKSSYVSLLSIYGSALDEAERVIESDDVKEITTVIYLQNLSIRLLDECQNNPIKALDQLTDFFEDKLKSNGKTYDHCAIKFYLISQIIRCNVFPNEANNEN